MLGFSMYRVMEGTLEGHLKFVPHLAVAGKAAGWGWGVGGRGQTPMLCPIYPFSHHTCNLHLLPCHFPTPVPAPSATCSPIRPLQPASCPFPPGPSMPVPAPFSFPPVPASPAACPHTPCSLHHLHSILTFCGSSGSGAINSLIPGMKSNPSPGPPWPGRTSGGNSRLNWVRSRARADSKLWREGGKWLLGGGGGSKGAESVLLQGCAP